MLRAPVNSSVWVGAIRCESTREGMAEFFSRYKYNAIIVVGRREKSLLCDPGSELRVQQYGPATKKLLIWASLRFLLGRHLQITLSIGYHIEFIQCRVH